MNRITTRMTEIAAALGLLAIGVGGGYWWGQTRLLSSDSSTAQNAPGRGATNIERQVLYWYDPMVPDQHFDKPGKSPFMDMQLVPKFGPGADSGCTVRDVETATAAEPRP